ncbi:hypothetical protein XA68_14039 [Ophiocordyceps unilateralis]|uniref:Uncharacterized protein n=1 Tax=Ophiocordyceps unilateralis TaxID=268505 RepID=A0A2A9P9V7_OPHUN|nr:hypothetical protein XA68_14039 [Ophiocordyceps unilateralis]
MLAGTSAGRGAAIAATAATAATADHLGRSAAKTTPPKKKEQKRKCRRMPPQPVAACRRKAPSVLHASIEIDRGSTGRALAAGTHIRATRHNVLSIVPQNA